MDNIKNIEIIVQMLKAHQLNYIVISPGGTNQALIKMVQDDPFFTCYSIVDERSALYFAIGLYLQYRKPIVTSCTSAQATRNYIPGLTEAFYKKVPILAISMCKHPRFTYQEYMQAPDQASLPKDCVKQSFVLPCISDENDVIHATRLVNESILSLTDGSFGPVQLCVPWLDFPINKSSFDDNKIIKRIERGEGLGDLLKNKRIMICIGEHFPFEINLQNAIEEFCEKNNVVVYTNHLSNYHGHYSIQGNIPLLVMNFENFVNELQPELLITIGGQTGDYPFYNLFSRMDIQGIEHWRVSPDGRIVDTYDKLTKTIRMSELEFFIDLNRQIPNKTSSHELYNKWLALCQLINLNVKVPFSAISVAQYLCGKLPANSILQFSILNSLRVWNMFHVDPSIECYSNVGAFGIDGGMSTLIGQSVATDKMSFMIIGDLSFLYDINSISIRHIKNNLRILIINNAGGVEFKIWGGDHKKIDKYIAAAGHYRNAEGWAKTCGFMYLSARTQQEFEGLVDAFTERSDHPIVFEVFVSDRDEAKAYSDMLANNQTLSLSGKAKKLIKRVIG